MKKELKDYLFFYVGGIFQTETGEKHTLTFSMCDKILNGELKGKLLLRKLLGITDQEEDYLEEQFDMTIQNDHGFYTSDGFRAENFIPKNAEIFKYLLKQRFDIFNLAEDELATLE